MARKRVWIKSRIAETPKRIPFVHGAVLPLLGKTVIIEHMGGRGLAHLVGKVLKVPGDEEFVSRRVRDFLKETARCEITRLAHEKSAVLGKTVRKITIRDTTSLWGSCSRKGHLSFSWRLVLAPSEVLDYLVAHEVAHLVHMNHSPAFWQVVAGLCPDYATHRAWLRKHGESCHQYQ